MELWDTGDSWKWLRKPLELLKPTGEWQAALPAGKVISEKYRLKDRITQLGDELAPLVRKSLLFADSLPARRLLYLC